MEETEHEKGYFTGASGGTMYAAGLFPEEYYGNIFTGDVAGSLVHRDIIRNIDSPYLKAQRGQKENNKEFMVATDSWVRPASFTVGPDGALYMMDMYRQHIETPLSIPEDLQIGMDFNAGNKYGRIYRLLPKNAPAYKKIEPDLKNRSSEELVKVLAHPGQWWRLQAQRLLLERQDKTVIPAARQMFIENKDPRARLHALYVLEGLNTLTTEDIRTALKDKHPGVRINAAILSEQFPECVSSLADLVNDPSTQVAFQATLSLGDFNNPAVVSALATVVKKYGGSSWFRTAVLSSVPGSSPELLKALNEDASFSLDTTGWKAGFLKEISKIISARNGSSK